MKRTLYKILSIAVRLILATSLIGMSSAEVIAQASRTNTSQLPEEVDSIDIQIKQELDKIAWLTTWCSQPYEIGSIRTDNNYALVSILCYSEHQEDPDVYAPSKVLFGIGYQDSLGWHVVLEGSKGFSETFVQVPNSLIDIQAKQILSGNSDLGVTAISTQRNIGLPWKVGVSWNYNNGPNWSRHVKARARDFQYVKGGQGEVLAAATGIVASAKETCMTVRTGDLLIGYQHISKSDINNWKNKIGDTVYQGDRIGLTTNDGGCGGTTSGRLVHFWTVPPLSNGDMVGGWQLDGTNGECFVRGSDRVCPWNSLMHYSASPCPDKSSPNVILYKHAYYDCGGEGEGAGWVQRSAPGWQNVPSSFDNQASSIHIPPGWSVKLYEYADRGGGWACREKDDINFDPDGEFSNGVDLNDNVSSFEVFNTFDCGPNNAPNPPVLLSPPDGYVSMNGKAPRLCWEGRGDPDGDSLTFQVWIFTYEESWNHSDWIHDTCWQPTRNDTEILLSWMVKASDGESESQSDYRTFTIRDSAPSISFNTANDNSFPSGVIYSRDTTWTFLGTASDPEFDLTEISPRISGDSPGHQTSHTNGPNWAHIQSGMLGRNDVYFVAYDGYGNSTPSRHLDLQIDLAAPTTQASLNNEANPANWPVWYTGPVQVRLFAVDGSTGRARVGVKEIHYQLDGSTWQTQTGDTVNFTVSNDGAHSVAFYAVDKLNNTENSRMVNFQIDRTPPSPPTGVVETNGVVSGQWQKDHNIPAFTWAASTDATSGVWGYQFYFGQDPAGTGNQTILVNQPRQWTPQPGGVHTGVYYLRGRTRDNASNWSAWANLFTYRYDGTPPENPNSVTHTAGIISTIWQSMTNVADFTWPVPHDEGSGIKGYYAYWGTDPSGITANLLTTNHFQDPTPLCDLNAVCTGYLRLRSMDNVDNLANEWSTGFVLRYDNVPPVVDFTFDQGMTTTNQARITLNLDASDEGSSVKAMRFSADGQQWTPWEVYTTTRSWIIPPISRQL